MMDIFSINYPAVACLVILAGMGVYHLWIARKEEFDSTILPSSFNLVDGGQPVSIWSEKDIAVNCPISIDQIACRSLIIGPKGILQVREISAQRIEVRGILQVLERVEGREEIVVYSKISAFRADTPRLTLKKRAEATIQVVSKETEVVRGRKVHTQGFFHSVDEFRRSQGKETSAAAVHRPAAKVVPQVRVLRAPGK